jgi:hypothetical protein
MGSPKITFILGAGASVPYDFPTGKGLVQDIVEQFADYDIYKTAFGWNKSDILELKKALKFSGLSSIDSFLENRDEYLDKGLLFIIWAIGRRESVENLFSYKSDNWYRYLFNRFKSKLGDFYSNKVSFITFNYDRSLEVFLEKSLQYTLYGHSLLEQTRKTLFEELNKIEIVHVYGQAGHLPWQSASNPKAIREFTGDVSNYDSLWECRQLINLVRDKKALSSNFVRAKEIIDKTNYLYFIGFGFDEVNVERLGLNQPLANVSVIKSTAYELGESVKGRFYNTLQPNDKGKLVWGGYKQTIVDFLDEHLSEV